MESELTEAAKKLESRRKALNEAIDLSKECASIEELKNRLGLVLEAVRGIRVNVERSLSLVANTCDKLEPDVRALQQVAQVPNIVSSLMRLNRLCCRLDNFRLFQLLEKQDKSALSSLSSSQIASSMATRRGSLMKQDLQAGAQVSEGDQTAPSSDDLELEMISETIDSFEVEYAPLEGELSRRPDLPYVAIANRARKVRHLLELTSDGANGIGFEAGLGIGIGIGSGTGGHVRQYK